MVPMKDLLHSRHEHPYYVSFPCVAKYSPRMTLAVSGIVPSIRFLRSFSSAFSISSVMESMKRFMAMSSVPIDTY